MINKTTHKNSTGYTLVETLIGMAILAGVLIPTVYFLSRMTTTRRIIDKMTAFSLAESEMEKTIGFCLYSESEKEVSLNSRVWHLVKSIREKRGLVMIRIEVYLSGQEKPLSVLETIRIR